MKSDDLPQILEHYSPLVAAVGEAWPYSTLQLLYSHLIEAINNLEEEQQVGLIKQFPQLASKAPLGEHSRKEHKAAGIDVLQSNEEELFARYNEQYFQRFGFPFVICAKDHSKEAIVASYLRRLASTREKEITEAIAQIKRIFWHRLVAAAGGGGG